MCRSTVTGKPLRRVTSSSPKPLQVYMYDLAFGPVAEHNLLTKCSICV